MEFCNLIISQLNNKFIKPLIQPEYEVNKYIPVS